MLVKTFLPDHNQKINSHRLLFTVTNQLLDILWSFFAEFKLVTCYGGKLQDYLALQLK